MEAPKHLFHKPIIAVNDYDKIDSQYANKSDAKALSIGYAQYDNSEISLKVWRYTEKWSRQSEELPLNRNLDLSILFLSALLTDPKSNYSRSALREVIYDKEGVEYIKEYFNNNKQYLLPRLKDLQKLLNDFFENKEEYKNIIKFNHK